ncbi:23146_t:CDS:2 [Dentiscutata erythropus]|uniref:23146_t:CDS:1 n=1 Tax=Dentiscutata erythropus TaxID=1348616 RepID=A0A9N9HVN5_9GLOM|nr:23146_t:CDS:2 [Dentiscutata erythropus]
MSNKSTTKFRLMAISCISHEDMIPKKEHQIDSYKGQGFTFIFSISKDNSVKNKELTIKHDPTILAYFLEYYSNNTINNIGWMNTVVEIIPDLYRIRDYAPYAQKLFHHPCFCIKQLDLDYFEFFEISPNTNGLLKITIPITQFIPQDFKFIFKFTGYHKISNVRMIPLVDFMTSRKSLPKSKGIFTNFLKSLFLIDRIYLYSSYNIGNDSPFIQFIESNEQNIYDENPSIEAAIFNFIDLLAYFLPLFILTYILTYYYSIVVGEAFSDVFANSKRAIYRFQSEMIREYAIHKNLPTYIDGIDSKFKDRFRAKYIYFYDDYSITKAWKEDSDRLKIEPYPKITIDSISIKEIEEIRSYLFIYNTFILN